MPLQKDKDIWKRNLTEKERKEKEMKLKKQLVELDEIQKSNRKEASKCT